MLNISENIDVNDKIDAKKYKAFSMFRNHIAGKIFARLMLLFFVLMVIFMFLPWTQNIKAKGYVTTLKPNQHPQTVHSIIGAKIEKWFVQEGDLVQKGDTILFLSETEDEYMDPDLLIRTKQQIDAKKLAVQSYKKKIKALDGQLASSQIMHGLRLKKVNKHIKEISIEIKFDSINFNNNERNYNSLQHKFIEAEHLHNKGLKSSLYIEKERLKLQDEKTKMLNVEHKLLDSRNEFVNCLTELSVITNQYSEKLNKAESDKHSALSAMYNTEAQIIKMQNKYVNYSMRASMYYVTAPRNGYVTQLIEAGIGEMVKQGDDLLTITPKVFDLAVEMYVTPLDIPLLMKGDDVRFTLDAWSSVFAGWSNNSSGTFGGKVVAIDNFINKEGKYRVLVARDKDSTGWTKQLKVGARVNGIVLLKDVPMWYEIWRRLNNFPPDYYKPE